MLLLVLFLFFVVLLLASVVALVVSSFCSVLALSVLDVSVVSGFMPSTSTISSMQAFSNSTASPAFAGMKHLAHQSLHRLRAVGFLLG